MTPRLLFAAAEIPPLRPPREEIPPTFVEQYGWWPVIAGVVVALVTTVVVLRLLRRTRPSAVESPEVTALRTLESWRNRSPDAELVRDVAGVVRRFVVRRILDSNSELTTTELASELGKTSRLRPDTTSAVISFLKQCDTGRFSPSPPPWPPDIVGHGSELIRRTNSDWLGSQPAESIASTAAASSTGVSTHPS